MRRSLLLVPAGAALGVLALLWLGPRSTGSTETVRSALSPQGCVTSCQTQQTDCILACDGVVSCEKKCVAAAEGCVRRCLGSADAGRPSP